MFKNLISLFNLTSLRAAVIVHALTISIHIITSIYANAIFISSYPSHWIPYLFVGQTFIDFISTYSLKPILLKKPRQVAVGFSLIAAISVVVIYFLQAYPFYFLPLISSFVLITLGTNTGLIASNNTQIAFDSVQFKRSNISISVARTVSNMITSFAVLLFLQKIDIIYLSLMLAGLLCINAYAFYFLKPAELLSKANKLPKKIYQNSLFRNLFTIVAVIAVCYTLIDYCFYFQLSTSFNTQEIASFLGAFYALISCFTLLINFIGVTTLTRFVNIIFLLHLLPLFWLFSSLLVVWSPTLWAIAIMASGKRLIYYYAFDIGKEVSLNALPAEIRLHAQIQLKVVASSVAAGVASVFLLLSSAHLTIREIAILVGVICALLLIYMRKVRQNYINTLKNELFLKRFITHNHITRDKHKFKTLVHDLLNTNNAQMQQTASYKILKYIEKHKNNIFNFTYIFRILITQPNSAIVNQLLELARSDNIRLRQQIANAAAYAALTQNINPSIKNRSLELAITEYHTWLSLLNFLRRTNHPILQMEIKSRMDLARKRLLYWLAVHIEPQEILGSMPILLNSDKVEIAKTIQLLEATISDIEIHKIFIDVFYEYPKVTRNLILLEDKWLDKLSACLSGKGEIKLMNIIQRVGLLRKVKLFEELSLETLVAIAEELMPQTIKKGQMIFKEGDAPTGLYIIVEGSIAILKYNKKINELGAHDFFGELALLDDYPRSAGAQALMDTKLLFLDKNTFNRLNEDSPEVLKSLLQVIMRYLRGYISDHT